MSKSTWVLDPTHSEVGFKIKHMMFTNVSGKFNQFAVTLENENDDFSTSTIAFEAQVASIDTANSDRDNHLKSGDFFDAETFPSIRFKSNGISGDAQNGYILNGDLTIKETTKPVSLAVEYSGLMKDPWGNLKTGYSVSGEINRVDFGLTWNAALEAGGILVSEKLKVQADIQLVKG